MGTTRDAFAGYCVELLAAHGSARAKRMFGGHGLYLDDLFIAIVAKEQLYLKVDAQTRPQFEAAGCMPFIYDSGAKSVAMSYFAAPGDAMESPTLMQPWARLAVEAALRAKSSKPASARRNARAKPLAADATPRKSGAAARRARVAGRS
jgi:DNA transformation protein and related proteins